MTLSKCVRIFRKILGDMARCNYWVKGQTRGCEVISLTEPDAFKVGRTKSAPSNLVRLQLLFGNFGPRIQNYLRSPLRHFPPHSSCFARFSKMGGPILVTPHRMHCTTPVSQASPSSSPYRPAVILPGLENNSGDYQKLVQTLTDKYGVPTVVAKVSRIDWLRNAAGLVDPYYWRGTLKPRPVLDWYLKRVHDAVQEAKELAEG